MRRRSHRPQGNKLEKPAHIGICLDGVLEKIGGRDKFDASKLFVHWPQLVGDSISANTKPQRFDDGILYVNVRDSAWLMELRAVAKCDILRAIRNKMNMEIRDIIFKLGPVS